jgi:hypothetical protein
MGTARIAEASLAGSSLKFYSIPVTDESKLLPSDGIYAVSVEASGISSKGMVIITTLNRPVPSIFLSLPENGKELEGVTTSLLFRKKITGPVNLSESVSAALKMNMAAEEISELIY